MESQRVRHNLATEQQQQRKRQRQEIGGAAPSKYNYSISTVSLMTFINNRVRTFPKCTVFSTNLCYSLNTYSRGLLFGFVFLAGGNPFTLSCISMSEFLMWCLTFKLKISPSWLWPVGRQNGGNGMWKMNKEGKQTRSQKLWLILTLEMTMNMTKCKQPFSQLTIKLRVADSRFSWTIPFQTFDMRFINTFLLSGHLSRFKLQRILSQTIHSDVQAKVCFLLPGHLAWFSGLASSRTHNTQVLGTPGIRFLGKANQALFLHSLALVWVLRCRKRPAAGWLPASAVVV